MFLLLHARFLGVVWSFEHTCFSHCFISRFTVESVQCRNESNGRHPVSRVVQRILGKYAALSVCVDQVGTWLFTLLSTRLETWNSRGMYMDLSRGMNVNEFADLTTSEFVSEYTGEKPNILWCGRKHLEAHEYINEPLDQVKSDSCFRSSDEGPSFLFLCGLEIRAELSVILCCHLSFPEFCALVTSSLDQDSGRWVVSKVSHFGITVSCSWFADVTLCSLVCSSEPSVFPGY